VLANDMPKRADKLFSTTFELEGTPPKNNWRRERGNARFGL